MTITIRTPSWIVKDRTRLRDVTYCQVVYKENGYSEKAKRDNTHSNKSPAERRPFHRTNREQRAPYRQRHLQGEKQLQCRHEVERTGLKRQQLGRLGPAAIAAPTASRRWPSSPRICDLRPASEHDPSSKPTHRPQQLVASETDRNEEVIGSLTVSGPSREAATTSEHDNPGTNSSTQPPLTPVRRLPTRGSTGYQRGIMRC